MANNYGEIAFSAAAKELQEKLGSRTNYARMEKDSYVDGLTENEIEYIAARDSFYMATIGENGFPYIQHRGGPKGFLKVLNSKRVGFIDFKGNMQFISVGNMATNNNVALIMVDYPARARLKIYAKGKIIELKDDPALFALLDLKEYTFRPERMMVFDIEAYDWNCRQHITPRYTLENIEEAFAAQRDHIAKLEAEIKTLLARTP
jgi:uncharacterized protein